MNRYKLTIFYTDNTFTDIFYKSDKNYDDEFEELQKNINNHHWFNSGDDTRKQSINTNNIKYWMLEKKSSYDSFISNVEKR